MRILDRYAVRQLLPVWLWCIVVFLFLSCLIDLFEHLDEILRYRVPTETVWEYYRNFVPLVFVKASPLALLFSAAFVAMRSSRYQELLAMSASGTSRLRAAVPFLFVGWLVSLCVFAMNELVVPRTVGTYERLRREAFRSQSERPAIENVAVMDSFNRLYHARQFDAETKELRDLTVLEHDWHNNPTKSLYASRAVWTKHGWLLLHGTIYRVGPGGSVRGEPEPFVERLVNFPVDPASFSEPETKPETMGYTELRLLVTRIKHMGFGNERRYRVELASKLTLPLMNMVVCLIAFAGSTQPQLRGNLKGLGLSLLWGIGYYILVGFFEGMGKRGVLWIPVPAAVWTPHLLALWYSVRAIRRQP
jgi:LPS export ABC transporter permease LptG